MIGIGVMGRGMSLLLAEHGYEVHMHNKTSENPVAVLEEAKKLSKARGIALEMRNHESYKQLVAALDPPRIIILLLPAGSTIDLYMERFKTLLSEEDVVIDAGNSRYQDTERRMREVPFQLVGCGVSGGEYGARHGASMVFGCEQAVYDKIKTIFEKISAKINGISCCGRVGNGGSAHFVKSVHNGIEYCEMQLLQEAYHIVRAGRSEKDGIQAAKDLFSEWKDGEAGGFLAKTCVAILSKKEGGDTLLLRIQDKAGQKGTGKMCVELATELDCATPAIAESMMARFLSQEKERRIRFAERIAESLKIRYQKVNLGKSEIRKAFLLCKAVSFIQGFDLIESMEKKEGWSVDIPSICRVWRAGCILESIFLDTFLEMANAPSYELSDTFCRLYKDGVNELRKLCSESIKVGIPLPVFSSCLAWLDGLAMDRENAQLVQAMRDAFGRHKVEMEDGRVLSIDWHI